MSSSNHFVRKKPPVNERIDLFGKCEFARLLGMEILRVWPGGAEVAMDIPGKKNPLGNMHGGAIFSLADHAFGIAANSDEIPEVALSAQINYISPSTGRIVAIAERVAESETGSLVRVTVRDGERIVATFEGIGIRMGNSRE